jgi:hypothetical protein
MKVLLIERSAHAPPLSLQAGGHWFEPSTAQLENHLQRWHEQ